MSWVILVVAGLLEVVWASALSRAHQPSYLLLTVLGLGGSVGLLALATRELPLGMAYAVWVGIGMLGTAAVSSMFHGEQLNASQWACLAMVMAGIVGMKLTSHGHAGDEVAAVEVAGGSDAAAG
jgi:quaternary ammonium compound-resistance protein SugE